MFPRAEKKKYVNQDLSSKITHVLCPGSDFPQALEILARLHCDGNTTNPIVQAEFKEICDTIEFEKGHMGSWASLVQPGRNPTSSSEITV